MPPRSASCPSNISFRSKTRESAPEAKGNKTGEKSMVDISKQISVVNSKEKIALMKGGACHQTGNRIRRERKTKPPANGDFKGRYKPSLSPRFLLWNNNIITPSAVGSLLSRWYFRLLWIGIGSAQLMPCEGDIVAKVSETAPPHKEDLM